MKIFPAIDILGGRAVRLTKGDYGSAKSYSSDPAAVAAGFKAAGAEYLHIVDLDGAREGKRRNADVIRETVDVSALIAEVGGGIRSIKDIEYYLSCGVRRVVLGTAAVRDPRLLSEAVREFGDRVAVGMDLRDGLVAVNGWLESEPLSGEEFLRRISGEGVAAAIVTDIGRDGLLSGANIDLYARLSAVKGDTELIASGGITKLDEIGRLKAAGAGGAILGKALYEGKLDLGECLGAAREAENAG